MKLILPFEIDVPFKGQRDYIHSADVYHAVLSHLAAEVGLENCDDVRLIFRSFARTSIRVGSESPSEATEPNATFTCLIKGEKLRLSLMETGDEVVLRVAYPEHEIVNRCSIDTDAREVSLNYDAGLANFDLMEIIVAMNKAMHLSSFKEHPGKWLFTETRNLKPLFNQPWQRLQIRLKNELGVKLTRSTIEIDGENVGYLCFSLQPPKS